MNGVRSTFMRRGYLLTALSALLLLAASAGTAEAQRVSIGFVETSGTVSENTYLEPDDLLEPARVTVQVQGLNRSIRNEISTQLGGEATDFVITPSMPVRIAMVDPQSGSYDTPSENSTSEDPFELNPSTVFATRDEVVLVVAQSSDGTPDPNWQHERIELKLSVGGRASVSPDVYTLTVEDGDDAPVVRFNAPSFTVTEGNNRPVRLDVHPGGRPTDAIPGAAGALPGPVYVRVGNHEMVTVDACPTRADDNYGQYAVGLNLMDGEWGDTTDPTDGELKRTGLLRTRSTFGQLADLTALGADAGTTASANMEIQACGDAAGFRDPQVTLTILGRGITAPSQPVAYGTGNPVIGSPLTVTVDSDEAAPTLSFSPTDVTIDEGDSVSTRLIADGMSATEVGMVKLMVEGDAMVDLYHEDTMLEEMDGYVMVDMGMSNSARLTAMSMESRELQDGDMAYKAWKLVDGSSDAMIGDDSWFRVDVRGSTAVPALPLIGQLLLALFLMAGGSRLYRRRRG